MKITLIRVTALCFYVLVTTLAKVNAKVVAFAMLSSDSPTGRLASYLLAKPQRLIENVDGVVYVNDRVSTDVFWKEWYNTKKLHCTV